MPRTEPSSNIREVCAAHAPRPDAQLAQRPAESFLGCWVKCAFAAPGTSREHMWVHVESVTPGGQLAGTLDSTPVAVVGLRRGDRVGVALAAVEAVYEPSSNLFPKRLQETTCTQEDTTP